MFKALTIAGSDTSGGAGLQADIKTFQELDVYGMAAITVMVAQNPKNHWSHDIYPIDIKAVEAQIDTVLGGIGVDALKTGMLPSAEIIELAAAKIKENGAKNIVIDPVMVCKGTDDVVNPLAVDTFKKALIPLADVVTPNIYEASHLSGVKIDSVEKTKEAAKVIYSLGAKSVFIKGGTKLGLPTATDVYFDGKDFTLFEQPVVTHGFTHGAGCTTAAAITAYLARGLAPKEAVAKAKEFITAALNGGFRLNQYVGAVRHSAHRQGK